MRPSTPTNRQFINRPAGITYIANFCRIGGGIAAVVGIVIIAAGIVLFVVQTLLALISLVCVFYGSLAVVTGIAGRRIGRGLLELKNWARISLIVIALLSLVVFLIFPSLPFVFLYLAPPGLQSAIVGWVLFIAWTGFIAAMVWYLLRPDIETVFQSQIPTLKRTALGRPAGVTVIAIVFFFIALNDFMLLLRFTSFAIRMPSGFHSPFTIKGILESLIVGTLAAIVGWGLWKRKSWARFLSIGIITIQILESMYRSVRSFSHSHSGSYLVFPLILLSVCSLAIGYLLTSRVRQTFIT
jgi:hypothetical protein